MNRKINWIINGSPEKGSVTQSIKDLKQSELIKKLSEPKSRSFLEFVQPETYIYNPSPIYQITIDNNHSINSGY